MLFLLEGRRDGGLERINFYVTKLGFIFSSVECIFVLGMIKYYGFRYVTLFSESDKFMVFFVFVTMLIGKGYVLVFGYYVICLEI